MRTFHGARLAFLKTAGVKFNSTVAILTRAGDELWRFVWRDAHGTDGTCCQFLIVLTGISNSILPVPPKFAAGSSRFKFVPGEFGTLNATTSSRPVFGLMRPKDG